jgi:hypothetical protein
MKPEVLCTILFGTIAAVIAIATMIQNFLQRSRGMLEACDIAP